MHPPAIREWSRASDAAAIGADAGLRWRPAAPGAWRGVLALLLAIALGPTYADECRVGPATPPSHRVAEIDAVLTEAVDNGIAPGFLLRLESQGNCVLQRAFGYRELAPARPMTGETLFRIYSMTKPLTAVATMILVEEGKASLDDPVSRYLPYFSELEVYAGVDGNGEIRTERLRTPLTIRHLMTHTAGIIYVYGRDHPVRALYRRYGIPAGSGFERGPEDGLPPITDLESFSRTLARMPLMHQPSAAWTYGGATDLLGYLVERISGRILPRFLEERLFTPLGMRDTGFVVGPADRQRFAAMYLLEKTPPPPPGLLIPRERYWPDGGELVLLDDPRDGVFTKNRPIAFGGAGLVSTAADYGRFLAMLNGDGSVGATRILSPSGVAEVRSNHLPPAVRAESMLGAEGLGYGYSVAVVMEPERSPAPLPRGGLLWGGAASTFFFADPGSGLSVVLMSQVMGEQLRPVWTEVLRAIYAAGEETGAAATPQNRVARNLLP